MNTRFDLYLITRDDGSTNFNIDLNYLKSIFKDDDDLTVKVFTGIGSSQYRDLHEGSIRLIGYFDNNIFKNDNLNLTTTFCRVDTEKAIGVELFAHNANQDTLDKDEIILKIHSAINFFNKLITKIN